MRRFYTITAVCCLISIFLFGSYHFYQKSSVQVVDHLTVGFIYVGDESNPYTMNFVKAQKEIEAIYGDKVSVEVRENVFEGAEEKYVAELCENCDIIFATSYGYENTMKAYAKKYPNIQFCMATGDNANSDEVLPNYHTFMGHIYEGRYVSGVVAGMKLKSLIDNGTITPEQAVVGYVAAFPYSEVISGYTAFLLGVHSIVPEATMRVRYTNSWGNYSVEKEMAKEFIEEGCVIISQHSDTTGPAIACEEAKDTHVVYHVGYNQSMMDVAPTTSLVSCRINWKPYFLEAVGAVFEGKKIEDVVDANVNGQDAGAGFEKDWVAMVELNTSIASSGTQSKMDSVIEQFRKHELQVFKGDYVGVDPFDETDTYDLSKGYVENESASAPSFHYILKDYIIVEE